MLKLRLGIIVVAANVVGVSYAATKLGTAPPQGYCDTVAQYDVIRSQANKQFAEDGSDGKWDKRRAWIEKRVKKVDDKLSKALGVSRDDWDAAASENEWGTACESEATEKRNKLTGLVQVRLDGVSNISDNQVQRVRNAVELEYLARLQSGKDAFFDPGKFSDVSCREAEVDGYRFVGCKMRSFTAQTHPDVYLVGHQGGEAIAIPYDGEAKARVAGATTLATREETVPLGVYEGSLPLVEFTKIRRQVD
ncbi:MAG: hypothetical protein EOS73_09935 [Mesorhizobium sp.]|uniref:hypothetical protein n=1 Tax=Mesorhizobium sp. M7A.F.Ca.ET.027.02.1.1 TaxID=2496655 RepID=UPI000FD47170|nr:hypothetical protein [Mesorhizobium sp. M7A.F.Ca.ET.027.02.1.1]RVD18168.1 hypothetical protein EN749_06075 [Mesorhizobium sp. M7A.F.Ca.ET.027.02.1.1]RWD09708.1 MAG: hypothetical protein EOS73_09935 [Mesorhizobium sp.]